DLVRIDPRKGASRPSIVPLPTALGPLRSVQTIAGGRHMLAGARSGVMKVNLASPAEVISYSAGQVESQMGFNRAVVWNDLICASHSELGIVAWSDGDPKGAAEALAQTELKG